MLPADTALIDNVYEAAFLPERWPDVLDRLCGIAECSQGLIFANDGPSVGRWIGNDAIQESMRVYEEEGWAERDVITARSFARREPRFITTEDLFDGEADYKRHVAYQGFYIRCGMGVSTGTVITAPEGNVITFGLHRSLDHGPVEAQALDRLNALRPHLARAALTASRLRLEQARIALEALKALRLPACAFSSEGHYRLGNSLFEALMPRLAQDRRERLTFTDPAADALLKQAFDDLRTAPASARGRSFPLKGQTGEPPFIVHVVPVCGESRDVFSHTQGLVIVVPVALNDAVDTRLIEGLFDLTPAEAAIAGGLLEGQTLDDIAGARGTSLQTTRTQLKAVMQKTGTNRQADLVRLLSATRLGTGEP